MEVGELKGGDRNTFVGWSATPGVEGGGYSGFQVTGIDDRNILGALKFSVSGFLGEVKFGKYFSG